jgi:DNA-binding NtrC family response regulator
MNEPHSGRSVLVVDDDESMRSIVTMCLRNSGYNVVGTSGRSQVMALLNTRQFDVVITDIMMPDLDGSEVIRAVRTLQPDAAILPMSGGADARSELCFDLAMRLGASVPLIKPFHLDELLMAVEQALRRPDSAHPGFSLAPS